MIRGFILFIFIFSASIQTSHACITSSLAVILFVPLLQSSTLQLQQIQFIQSSEFIFSSAFTMFDTPLSPNIFRIILFCISIVLIVLAFNFFKKKADNKKFLTNPRLSLMDKEVQIACKYIERNFRDPALSISSMCDELVTGPAFLEILFNKELGMSVDEFLAQVRMNRAISIIENEKNISLDDLILRIGFTDNNQFANSFKEIIGNSFSEYQKLRKHSKLKPKSES